MKKGIVTLFVSLAMTAAGATSFKWVAESAKSAEVNIPIGQGETVTISPLFMDYGRPRAFGSNDWAALYYQTNGMGDAWYTNTTTAYSLTETGRVNALWSPDLDVGASKYRFFVGVVQGTQITYRAFGTISMRKTPGFLPAIRQPNTAQWATYSYAASAHAKADEAIAKADLAIEAAAGSDAGAQVQSNLEAHAASSGQAAHTGMVVLADSEANVGDLTVVGNVNVQGTVVPAAVLMGGYGSWGQTDKPVMWMTDKGIWRVFMQQDGSFAIRADPEDKRLTNDVFEVGARFFRFGGDVITNWYKPTPAGAWRNPDWFDLSWLDNPTNAPDSTTLITNLDQVILRQGFSRVRHDRTALIENQHGFYDLTFSVTPTNIASLSESGYLTHLADGVCTTIVSAGSYAKTNTLFLRTEGGRIDRYWDAAPGTLRQTCLAAVDAHVTNASIEIFTSVDTGTLSWVRNPALWFRPAPECISPWNSRAGPLGAGVLVTPRHAITAKHASFRPQVGDTVAYVDGANNAYTAQVTAEVNVAGDLNLIQLDTAMDGVARAKLIPTPTVFFPTGIRYVPVGVGEAHAGGNKLQLGIAGRWLGAGTDYSASWYSPDKPSWQALFYHWPVSGDSSQPVLMTTGTDVVLLFCLLGPDSGPCVHLNADLIQQRIRELGDTETLEYINVDSYQEF